MIRRPASGVGIACTARLMRKGVHCVIHAEFQRGSRSLHRYLAPIETFPELAEVIVIVNDHHEPAMIVFKTPEFDWAATVGWLHVKRFNLVKGTENLMGYRQRRNAAIGEDLL